jgi:demethoxyubiquinone hydroxylase (CLK1/Coq7/Cat5 family)
MSPDVEGPMHLEQIVLALQTDVAVIRAHLDNHVTAITEDLRELRGDVRNLRDKVEHLAVTQPTGSAEWKTVALMVSGWAFGLLMLVIEFLLKR